MKSLKQLGSTLLLTAALAATVRAGEIHIPAPTPPPPPESSSFTIPGDIGIPGGASATSQADYSATDVAFDLLQAVLTIF